MAANHIAMVRSSARSANARPQELFGRDNHDDNVNSAAELSEKSEDGPITGKDDNRASLADELSQMSVISIPSDGAHNSRRSTHRKDSLVADPLRTKLRALETVSDIDDCVDVEQSYARTLDSLESNWTAIANQYKSVLDHLSRCSKEVSLASENCLESLLGSIELTCDKVDAQMKALYQLMSKCDELTTKLSIASSFREEIKTLRKSVETLETLYKLRPKISR